MSKLLTTPGAKAAVCFKPIAREAHPKLASREGCAWPLECYFVRDGERVRVTVWLHCVEIPVGEQVEAEISFYCRNHRRPSINVGSRFELWWDGILIGTGSITEGYAT